LTKLGRNEPCPCGSGKKYKKCCLNDQKRNFEVIEGGASSKKPLEENFFANNMDKAQSDLDNQVFEINCRGHELLDQGNLDEAEKVLADGLQDHEDTVMRNNLAVTRLLKGELEKSLETLAPLLNPDNTELEGSPYTYGVAAQLCALLNRLEESRAYLDKAIWLYDKTIAKLKSEVPHEKLEGLREYTVQIMRAAAYLEDHRQVLDLFYHWEDEHARWENYFMAAVASFNLGRYQQAISLWKEVGKYWPAANSFPEVTGLVERGVIPPFSLPYHLSSLEKINQQIEGLSRGTVKLEEALQNSIFCMMLLSFIFETQEEEDTSLELLEKLVANGGKWGEELGKNLIHAYYLPTSLQMSALHGLVLKGVYKEGEPIIANLEGEEQEVTFKKNVVAEEPDKQTQIAMKKAKKLQKEGRYQEAIEHLERVTLENNFYPPAAINLSILLRFEDRLQEAEKYLMMAEEIIPEDPLVLFNLSALMLDQGRPDEAEEYFLRIDKEKASEEILEQLELLEYEVYNAKIQDLSFKQHELMRSYEEMCRADLEEKPVTTKTKLHTSLKKLPAAWLDVICNILEIEPARRRKEREKQLYEALLDQNNLKRLLEIALDSPSRSLLGYLLKKGGWERLSAVSQKFGTLEGAGYFWEEDPPEVPTALVWSVGLAIVGRTNLDKRREKVVVIPEELRQPLADLLNIKSGEYQATQETEQTQQLSFHNFDDS